MLTNVSSGARRLLLDYQPLWRGGGEPSLTRNAFENCGKVNLHYFTLLGESD